MYLLDTNMLIYFFKNKGHVSEYLINTPPANIATSVITVYKIEVGLAKSTQTTRRRKQFTELLNTIHCISYTQLEAKSSAQIRANLESQETPIGPMDKLIAGTALANGAIPVTHNINEFSRVPGLTLEDWY